MFKGQYKFRVRYVDSNGQTHGGYIVRDFKKTQHVFIGGKERFLKKRAYIISRHD